MDMEERFIVAVFGVFLLALPILMVIGFGFPQQGEHTGYITAVDTGGFWRLTRIYFKTDNQSSQEDSYCIEDSLVEIAREYSSQRRQTTLVYNRGWFVPIWTCRENSTGDFVRELK